MFSQTIYEENGFNNKQLLVLNDDHTFDYKVLGMSCSDLDAGMFEISGKYETNGINIYFVPLKITKYIIPHQIDSLNIHSDSLDIVKKVEYSRTYQKKDGFLSNFKILRYKNYEFLIESDKLGKYYGSIKDQYLELSNLIDEDDRDLNYFMNSRLNLLKNNNFGKEDLISTIPKEYKKYFHKKPINSNVLNFKEKHYRDKEYQPSVPDEMAMLYEYEINLDKGKKDGVFASMLFFPQKDKENCFGEFRITSSSENTSKIKIILGDKCNLENNIFSTKR